MTREQFEKAVLPLQNNIYRYAASRLSDLGAAKDIVQEVLLKLWKKKDDLDKVDNMEAWVMRITRNTCLDRIKSPKNQTVDLEIAVNSIASSWIPDRQSEALDLLQMTKVIIKELPELQQEIFRLRDLMGYSNQEIEALLSLTPNQVKVNLCRARQKVRQRLTQMMNYGLTN